MQGKTERAAENTASLSSEHPFHFLKSEFDRRKQKNSRYSLRAFARQMGVHPSTLSNVLNGKRYLSVKDAYHIAEKLELEPQMKKKFFSSLFEEKKKFSRAELQYFFTNKNNLSDSKSFDIIAEWEHYVLLFLIPTEDFRADYAWMAQRLGITTSRAEKVFKRLVEAALVNVRVDGEVVLAKKWISSSDELSSRALQNSHRESLKAAAASLVLEKDLRDLTSLVFPLDPKLLPKIKKEIRSFHTKIGKLAGKSKGKEVYELLISLFPRTK